ncbi:MAG: S-layer homology domain-containing protein [Halothermotrichaceae bacterium]
MIKKFALTAVILSLLLFLSMTFSINSSIQAAEPTDISNHWAQDYILNLVNNDIINLYEDDSFKPDQPITRGEFATALAKQLELIPVDTTKFEDLKNYPERKYINSLVNEEIINGYPGDMFKPDKVITRDEIIAIMIKALGINNNKATIKLDSYQPFDDVPDDHWAANHIKIAKKINLANGTNESNFNPEKKTTRAEAAKLLTRIDTYSSSTGYITDVYPTSEKASVNLLDGNRKVFNFDSNTLVGRNNRQVNIDNILTTDKVFIIGNNDDKLEYVKAYGMVTQDDLAEEISTMTNGVFDNEEIKNLSDGNLEFLKPKLQTTVRTQLKNQGLNSEEINAIMSTNWNQLEGLSKNRLSEAIAIQTGVPLDISNSLVNGDWDKLQSYAQIELIQRLVQGVLNSELMS